MNDVVGEILFATLGRPGQKALYGLSNLPRTYRCEDIDAACAAALAADCLSYRVVKTALERQAAVVATVPARTQVAPEIRPIGDYQTFFDDHATSA